MTDERESLSADFIAAAREGDAPGARMVPGLLGEGRDVIFLGRKGKEAAFELMVDEEPIQQGCINLRPLKVIEQNLAEVDDRVYRPGLIGDEGQGIQL